MSPRAGQCRNCAKKRAFPRLHGNLDIELYPEIASRAEEYGFADVAVHDAPLRRPCWPLLCDIARATSRVIVGPDVTHPWFQHPAVIAMNMAHLDELSGGRALLGIGRGSMYDFVAMKDPSTLIGLEEAVQVIQGKRRRMCNTGS